MVLKLACFFGNLAIEFGHTLVVGSGEQKRTDALLGSPSRVAGQGRLQVGWQWQSDGAEVETEKETWLD
jgi:hypothetical protein